MDSDQFLKTVEWFVQGLGPYSAPIKKTEKEIKEMAKKVNDLCGMFLIPDIFVVVTFD